jgi:hypothetical protein
MCCHMGFTVDKFARGTFRYPLVIIPSSVPRTTPSVAGAIGQVVVEVLSGLKSHPTTRTPPPPQKKFELLLNAK